MNSNLNRALTAGLLAFGAAVPAVAQYDWDGHCIDPTNTQPYSNPFGVARLKTDLFGAAIGFFGTVAYTRCESTSAPVIGRIGFTIGERGSIQDQDPNQNFDGIVDDDLRLTSFTNWAQEFIPTNSYPGPYLASSVGGYSYARIYTQSTTDGAVNSYLYGSNGIRLGFIGRSGRYIYSDSTVNGTAQNNSIVVRCQIDVLGDAARVAWRMTNRLNLNTANATGTPIGIGLWFGQEVTLVDQFGLPRYVRFGTAPNNFSTVYTTIPGRRPLSVQERFNAAGTDPDGNLLGASIGVPPYVNFSASQVAGFGLQVVNSPSALAGFDPAAANANAIDQTPVDEFVFGEAPFLIAGGTGTTDPTFPDFIFNPTGPASNNLNVDAAQVAGSPAYVQKWQPTTVVPANGVRDIVAYYRSTNGDASYGTSFDGYTAVIDTPKSISTVSGDPNDFTPNPFTIRVNVDNTGGFSGADQFITMESVAVTLNLPAGMHAPGSSARTITRTISQVAPAGLNFADFRVQVDPTTYGALPYSVTIQPQPGFRSKTINGVINVATTPRLLVRSGPNLVAPPWQFADNSWETILNQDLNSDFQAYTWDATLQQYVPQIGAERGRGTWIVSSNDLGSRSLLGSPRQPSDQFPSDANYDVGGAPIVQLRRGWNLVGNPYNYAFDLGNILGVPQDSTLVLPYNELVNQGYTDGAFTPFDQSTKTYLQPIQGAGARLQPNAGYWIYANFDFSMKFPPLYDLFIRSATPAAPKQRFDEWRLQLSAATTNEADANCFVGVARKAADAQLLSFRKPPMTSPTGSFRASLGGAATGGNQQLLRAGRGVQTFNYNVYSNKGGPVTVSWPNLKEIPSNLAVSIKDTATGKTVNARGSAGYSYTAGAKTTRAFTVTVTPQGTVAQRVASASTSQVKMGPAQTMRIAYSASGRGSATIRVYRGKTLVGIAANDVDVAAGSNLADWPMTGLNGLPLDAGNYTLEIAATGEGGDTATRTIPVTIRR